MDDPAAFEDDFDAGVAVGDAGRRFSDGRIDGFVFLVGSPALEVGPVVGSRAFDLVAEDETSGVVEWWHVGAAGLPRDHGEQVAF